MNNITKIYVGVDISKDYLDVHFHPVKKSYRIPNDSGGIITLLKRLSIYDVDQIVCESSGAYENLMLQSLATNGYKIWQVAPKRIKAFIESEGIKFKTDKLDAKMIALFASQKKCRYDARKTSDKEKILISLNRRRSDLIDMVVQEKNRFRHPAHKIFKNSIKASLDFLKDSINSVETQIELLILENLEWRNTFNILLSVPGIGKITVYSLISDFPELGKISNKKISALLGVAPFTNESGNWKGKSMIKGGRTSTRNIFYMATISAIKYNPTIKTFYLRLVNDGKKKKVAIVAAMRKLICIINIMVKRGDKWRSS